MERGFKGTIISKLVLIIYPRTRGLLFTSLFMYDANDSFLSKMTPNSEHVDGRGIIEPSTLLSKLITYDFQQTT